MDTNCVIVGVSGASGVQNSVDFVSCLTEMGVSVKVVISDGAHVVWAHECANIDYDRFPNSILYNYRNLYEDIASGSNESLGMVVYPCSICTLSKISNSINDSLLIRAADVTLKEGRKLILVVRETPLHKGHLHLMLDIIEKGGIIMPFMPAFYVKDSFSMKENLKHFNGRILQRLGIDNSFVSRWKPRKQEGI
jgi:4-hydroxy-3-polyprenylbenzoate decarboxylase